MKINPLSIISITLIAAMFISACKRPGVLHTFTENEQTGLITLQGDTILAPQYKFINPEQRNWIQAKNNDKWGVIDYKGRVVVPFQYDYIGEISEERYCRVRLNEKYGVIDHKGRVVIPVIYDNMWFFYDGKMRVALGRKQGFINRRNEVVIPIAYDDFVYGYFVNGLIGARKDGKWGFIDPNGQVVVPFRYMRVYQFQEGRSWVANFENKWALIDSHDSAITSFEYDYPFKCSYRMAKFRNGAAAARKSGKGGMIDRFGKALTPFAYDCILDYYKGIIVATLDNQLVYAHAQGREERAEKKRQGDSLWWDIEKAPRSLPDYTHLLEYKNHLDYTLKRRNAPVIGILDGVYIKGIDTVPAAPPPPPPPPKPDPPKPTWTIEKVLSHSLDAMRFEPNRYPELFRLRELCIAYGFMIGGGNYGADLIRMRNEGFLEFRKKTLHAIVASESLRVAAWKWAKPYYKACFESMHPVHRETYIDIAQHLDEYIQQYDRKKMEKYLMKHEARFAQYDPDGTYNPYRKLYAFVDRLILVHQVISEEDAKRWIHQLAMEVGTWSGPCEIDLPE